MRVSTRAPNPQRIKHRIIGVENEYGMRILRYTSYRARLLQLLERLVPEAYAHRRLSSSGRIALPNASQAYKEGVGEYSEPIEPGSILRTEAGAHVEYAGPECLGAFQAALYETAELAVVARAVKKLREAFPGDETPLSLHKTNRSGVLRHEFVDGGFRARLTRASAGSHANYLTFARIPIETFGPRLNPFLVSRFCLIGNAWVEIVEGSFLRFLFSQRGNVMGERDIKDTSTVSAIKPLIHIKDESHADRRIWRRFHDVSGNANMAEGQLALKYGMFDLALAMIEGDFLRPFPLPVFPGKESWHTAAAFFNADIRCSIPVPFTDGTRRNALDIQRFYLDQAEKFFIAEQRAPFTSERKWGLEKWASGLDALARWDLEFLSRSYDWAAILYYFIMPTLSRMGYDPEALFMPGLEWSEEKRKRAVPLSAVINRRNRQEQFLSYILEMIISYANADVSQSPYGLLLSRGLMERLFSDEQVNRAYSEPPEKTRANWRETLLRFGERCDAPFSVNEFQWAALIITETGNSRSHSVYNINPYRFRVPELERGMPELLFREDLLSGNFLRVSGQDHG